MRAKGFSWLRFEIFIIIAIVLSFFLPWINWGKLTYLGIDIPFIYRKTTKISNTILFFLKKDSPHLAFYIFAVPILSILSFLVLLCKKYIFANILLFISSLLGSCLSLCMYYYFMTSKLFKLKNAGFGIHLLCVVGIIGLIYSVVMLSRKKKNIVIEETDSSLDQTIVADL